MLLTAATTITTAPPRVLDSSSSSLFPAFHHRRRIRKPVYVAKGLRNWRRAGQCYASLITSSDSFEVGRLIGSYGFMNVTSYSGFSPEVDTEYSSEDMGRLKVQDVGEGKVKIRLYEGRIAQGPSRGTPIIFKVYPGQRVAGIEADMMAANELNAHTFLQESFSDTENRNLQILIGGFETTTGEQWLAFRNDGKYSAADYAKHTSEKIARRNARGEQKSWNPFERDQEIKRRRYFVLRLLYGAIQGLAYMHEHDRLHQSIGPSSIALNTIMERESAYLVPRLRDLAFSVDIRYSSLTEAPGPLSQALWRRASIAGAFTPMDKKAFGIADDIYEAGLLFAYLAFIPFCEAGATDGLSLQRLLESTFKLDLEATREYCLADDRLIDAVNFLDLGNGAGWELLQAMLNPDFRKRPMARAIISHRFMTEVLGLIHNDKKRVSSLSFRALSLLFLSILVTSIFTVAASTPPLTYHGGKNVIRSFIKSLNYDSNQSLEPSVAQWWSMVESYQSVANPRLMRPKTKVTVVEQVTDPNYYVEKV